MSASFSLNIPTRWMDTDAYGHVNNVQYYSFFDTALTTWLIEATATDTERDPVIGLCVESKCTFHAPLGFPETVTAEVRAGGVGRSSVRYEIELFTSDGEIAASGYFVHVYVDRETRRPASVPNQVQVKLEAIAG